MNSKIKKLTSDFSAHHIDAFLITKDVNIQYLTEFAGSESWLLVCPHKSYYITDFRYIAQAKKGLKGIHVEQYTKSIHRTLFQLAKIKKVKRLGFDERHLSLAQYKILKKNFPKGIQLIGTIDVVEKFREVKDANEIKKIRKALKIHKEAHQYLKKIIRPGLSEREVCLRLENFVKSRGAGFSFDPIVASGPNSCYPHARVTDRKIRKNELVLVDMGIDLRGYKSDLTRMFFLGKIPKLIGQVNELVRVAQKKAIDKVKAGVPIAEIDDQARNYLAKQRLAKYFGHAIGHGIGLEIHENPRMSHENKSLLKEGMVITIEPAVYIPNKFGIRREEMVLVKKEGCEVISDDIDESNYIRDRSSY